MKVQLSLLTLFVILIQSVSYGTYEPLHCQGKRPELFNDEYFELARKIADENYGKGLGYSNAARSFAWSSSYLLKNLLFSGDVIFGDIISTTLQNEVDEIDKFKKLNSSPKIFLIRSSVANAFATESGAIFVTTALVANMENYYQLVYVLCHEIAHLERDHVFDLFASNIPLERQLKKNAYYGNYWGIEMAVMKFYAQSRENELEADLDGFQYYSALMYSQEEAVNSLQNLEKSQHDEFFNLRSDTFELARVFLPQFDSVCYKRKKHKSSSSNSAKKYLGSTHPDIEERIKVLKKNITSEANISESKNVDFFPEMKRIAMNETIFQHYLEHDYFKVIAAFYTEDDAQLNEEFLNSLYVRSLYMILKLRLQKIKLTTQQDYLDAQDLDLEYENAELDICDEILNPKEQTSAVMPFVEYFNRISLFDLWFLTSSALVNTIDSCNSCYKPYLQSCLELKDSCENTVDDKAWKNLPIDSTKLRDLETILKNKAADTTVFPITKHTLISPYSAEADSWFKQAGFNIEEKELVQLEAIKNAQEQSGNQSIIHSAMDVESTNDLNDYLEITRLVEYRMQLYFLDNLYVSLPGAEEWKNTSIHVSRIEYFHHLKRFSPIAIFVWYFVVVYYMIPNFQKTISHYELDINLQNGNIENLYFRKYKCHKDSNQRLIKIINEYYGIST